MTLELDNTRIADFKTCARYYYLRHVKGWKQEGQSSPAITFGVCWSKAMDALWVHKTIEAGLAGFMEGWYEAGLTYPLPLPYQKMWGYHTPETAKRMLKPYWEKRKGLIQNIELLSVDKCFQQTIDAYVTYLAKPDKVFKYEGDVGIVDHKSTGYGGASGFTFSWSESWHMSAQIDGYKWAISEHYSTDAKIWIDAALVNKAVNYFDLFPIRKAADWQGAWFDDTMYYIRSIEACYKKGFFPKNDKSCRRFNRLCEYFDVCRWHKDPDKVELPQGFKIDKWDPKK